MSNITKNLERRRSSGGGMFNISLVSTSVSPYTASASRASADWAPFVTLEDEGDVYTIDANIPGVLQENVKVYVQDGKVTIDAWGRGHDIENDPPSYTKSFAINCPVDLMTSVAKFTPGGQLNIIMPKQTHQELLDEKKYSQAHFETGEIHSTLAYAKETPTSSGTIMSFLTRRQSQGDQQSTQKTSIDSLSTALV